MPTTEEADPGAADDGLITPTSAAWSLTETLEALRRSPRVSAVMLLGSTGTDDATDASDVDLLLLVEDYPGRFGVETSIVDSRVADLVLIDVDAVAHLGVAEDGGIDAARVGESEWPYVHWLAEGRDVHDPDGLGRAAHDRAGRLVRHRPGTTTEQQRIVRAFLSHDVRVNAAMLRRASSDPDVATALGLRQLHTFVSAVQAWFTVRGVRSRGWKKDVVHLTTADPVFHRVVTSWLATTDIDERHELFVAAVEHVLEPLGGPVPAGMVSPGPAGVWESLVGASAQA